MEAQFKTEIFELHEFLTGWLSGNLPRSEATYAPFAAVLANDFVIISPSGEVKRFCGEDRANTNIHFEELLKDDPICDVTWVQSQAMSLSLLKFVGQASLVDDAMLPS